MIDKNIDNSIMEYIPISAFDLDKVSQKEVIINNNLSMKDHIKSFVITFVVAFAVVLVSNIDTISLSTLESGAIFGILFGAIRAGVKAILELVITKFS